MFGLGKKSILGVDIGSSIIKIVEIETRGKKPFLKNYAWARIDKYLRNDEIFSSSSSDVLAALIKEVFKKGKFKTKKSNIAVPSFSGLITLIDMPESIKDGDFKEAIKYEAHKYVPTSLDEVVLSWDVVENKNVSDEKGKEAETREDKKGKIQVLLVAASKMKVARYEEIVR